MNGREGVAELGQAEVKELGSSRAELACLRRDDEGGGGGRHGRRAVTATFALQDAGEDCCGIDACADGHRDVRRRPHARTGVKGRQRADDAC
jgi:hypothetical protein